MAQSFKERWAKALEDAQTKAAGMSEEEINANLGPTTRRAFDAAENLEGVFQSSFTGLRAAVLWTLGLGALGWALGAFVHLHVGPLWLLLAVTAAAFLFVFLSATKARRQGQDVPYFAGLVGFLACSAAGEGMEDSAAVGLVLLAAVGLTHLLVRRGAAPTPAPTPDDAGQGPTP